MTRAFWQYPICRGPLDHSGLGSSQATTWAWATLLLAIHELQYVLQYIVINKLFGNHQLILVFLFLFSVALAQNTTGVKTATTMAAASGNGPLVPYMRPCAPRRCVKWMGNNPPSLRMYSLGGLRVLWPSKCSFVPAMINCHNIGVFEGHKHPQQPQKVYPLAWGVIAHPFNMSA
jgi:hypothetical protein